MNKYVELQNDNLFTFSHHKVNSVGVQPYINKVK